MISKHCGKYLANLEWTAKLFSRRCVVCGKIYTQHKRQPKGTKTAEMIQSIAQMQLSVSQKHRLESLGVIR